MSGGTTLWGYARGMLRALRMRCPHCGRTPLRRKGYAFHERCAACGYVFQGESGDFWGGVVFAYTFAGIAGLATAAVLIAADAGSYRTRTYAAAAAALVAVFTLFPVSKSLWIHLLYLTRGMYEEYRPPRPPPAG